MNQTTINAIHVSTGYQAVVCSDPNGRDGHTLTLRRRVPGKKINAVWVKLGVECERMLQTLETMHGEAWMFQADQPHMAHVQIKARKAA